MRLNQYSRPVFSRNGRFLIVGVAPVIAPDDTTLVDFEKGNLDIWRWDAPMTPPQEKGNLESIRKHTLPVVMNLENRDYQLLTKNELVTVGRPLSRRLNGIPSGRCFMTRRRVMWSASGIISLPRN